MKFVLSAVVALFSLTTYCFPAGDIAKDSTTNQVSILTWNIKMLPRAATFLKHKPVKRAKLIPEVLLKESADVIVFQEAYDRVAMKILHNQLKAVYPYWQGWQNKHGITYKRAGGVIIFSKHPMKEVESIRYSWMQGINKLAGKGALLVEINHPVKTFQVLGTHMEAGGSRDLKKSQYKEAGELLKKYEKPGMPQFACGDFNTRRTDTILYPSLVNYLQVEDGDICTELKCTSDHLLNDMDSYSPTKRNLIDYVFYKGNGCACNTTTRSVMQYEKQWHKKHKDLSDHFAVLLKTYL